MRILAFDPGENTGWAYIDTGKLEHFDAGTIVRDFTGIESLIAFYSPHTVVYEAFRLYPGKAASMAWNDFYPVQVIGIIKFLCEKSGIQYVEQAASIKAFSGGIDDRWVKYKAPDKTEHSKDAYLHLKYYLRATKTPH